MAVKSVFRRGELVIRYTWVTIVEVVAAGSTLKLDQRCYSRYGHEEPLTGLWLLGNVYIGSTACSLLLTTPSLQSEEAQQTLLCASIIKAPRNWQ